MRAKLMFFVSVDTVNSLQNRIMKSIYPLNRNATRPLAPPLPNQKQKTPEAVTLSGVLWYEGKFLGKWLLIYMNSETNLNFPGPG